MTVRLWTESPPGAGPYFSKPYGLAYLGAPDERWVSISNDDGSWQMPLILRPISGGLWDATSPYGYSGIRLAPTLTPDAIAEGWADAVQILRELGVVSLFLRFPPFDPVSVEACRGLERLEMSHVWDTILVPVATQAEMWASMQGRSRTAIRKAERTGMVASVEPCTPEHLRPSGDFRALYEATMRRIGASSDYLYPDSYYREISALGDRLQLASVTNQSGETVAASLVLADDSFSHYHLAGSRPEYAKDGANNLLIWSVLKWSLGRGLAAVHLGGGTAAGDSLFKFKASFGGDHAAYTVGRCVLDGDQYERLVAERAQELEVDAMELVDSGFFPAYRTGIL